MINKIAYTIIVYFTGAFTFKLLGDMRNVAHVNYYWIFSSAVFSYLGFIIFRIAEYFKKHYLKRDFQLYRIVIASFSVYWGIMLILRIYVAFDTSRYDKLISSARLFGLGTVIIILIFALLIFKLLINDTANER